MSYILSLLKSKLPNQLRGEVSSSILCYYINDTTDIQIIRVVSEAIYRFERIVFPEERVLFEASLESYLEIHSPSPNGARITRSECRTFQVSEG
ncbi:DUF1830 domain-containing protein [Nodosilinea sp. FACHB-141]|uniref:DUF1830 domain-containing protein n=1 Tax=Cyanophyceae TaxID=3028117 RepID=UPI001688EFDE|nr:DUF1830 domain-containing protein [Nodosilinea sp. FACHB-141]